MRTSLHKLEIIEEAILNGKPEFQLLLEAQNHLDPEITESVAGQKAAYQLITNYGRQLLMSDIQQVEHKLLTESSYRSFSSKILSFFKF